MVYIMGEQQLILTNKLLEEMKLQDYQKDNTIYIDEDITSESVELWSRQLKNLGNKQLSKSKIILKTGNKQRIIWLYEMHLLTLWC